MTSRVRGVAAGIAASAAAFAFAAPALAQSPPPPATKSANVTAITSLAEPNAISANFHGNLMYLSHSRGLSIYDIADPAAPKRVGTLALPHFENEDVDTNGELLLISNDPSEGIGVLWVIDVRNPNAPAVIGRLNTGTIAPLGPFYGVGHTASCVQNCRYVYLAGNDLGIDIVDLTDPANPKLGGHFDAKEATGLASHDVQVDSEGLAWVAGYNGTAAYDVSNPLAPTLVYHTDDSAKSKYGIEPTDGKALNDFIHHNSMRMNNSSLASPPAGTDPAAESDVVLITEEDYNRPTCDGAGQFETWRIGADRVLRNLDSFVIEVDPNRTTLCSAHYFDERGGLVVQGWYEGGTRFLDVTNPGDIKQVGYWIPQKNVTWGAYYAPTDPSGSIVYALDNARGVDVIKVDRGKPDSSTPPVGGSGGGGGGGGGGGQSLQQSEKSPNIRLKIGDRRRAVRAGKRAKYTIDVRNRGRGAANGIVVTVELPRGVGRVRGGTKAARGRQVVYRLGTLGAGQTRRVKLLTKVSRSFRGKRLEISAAATADADVDPRDNFWVDRNVVKGGKKAEKGTSERTLAAETAQTPVVVAPPLGQAEQKRYAYRFGRLCRIALARS